MLRPGVHMVRSCQCMHIRMPLYIVCHITAVQGHDKHTHTDCILCASMQHKCTLNHVQQRSQQQSQTTMGSKLTEDHRLTSYITAACP